MVHHSDTNTEVLPIETLELLGGRLCLDFTNTMDPRSGSHPQEFLTTYADLVAWSRHVGICTQQQSTLLLQTAQSYHDKAVEAFKQALTLREALYRVFSALMVRSDPQRADLEVVQAMFAQAMGCARLRQTPQKCEWTWQESKERLDQMLWPVVCSAMELLTSEEWKCVKVCPGVGDCGWLFLDTSKNGSRQWCSMQACGSRAKMRRQYQRKRINHSLQADSMSHGG